MTADGPIYFKYNVSRADGAEQDVTSKHYGGCRYWVLDVDHDPFAISAIATYAVACEATHPQLATELRGWVAERLGLALDAMPEDGCVWCAGLERLVPVSLGAHHVSPRFNPNVAVDKVIVDGDDVTDHCWEAVGGDPGWVVLMRDEDDTRSEEAHYAAHGHSPDYFRSGAVEIIERQPETL